MVVRRVVVVADSLKKRFVGLDDVKNAGRCIEKGISDGCRNDFK